MTEQTAAQSPAIKANSGEYVAHEVKLVSPNVNLDPGTTPASSTGIQEGIVQGDSPPVASSQRTGPNGIQQSTRNYGVVPSFLIVPKRRVLHNVRSNLKTNVPGRLTLSGIIYRVLTGYCRGFEQSERAYCHSFWTGRLPSLTRLPEDVNTFLHTNSQS